MVKGVVTCSAGHAADPVVRRLGTHAYHSVARWFTAVSGCPRRQGIVYGEILGKEQRQDRQPQGVAPGHWKASLAHSSCTSQTVEPLYHR